MDTEYLDNAWIAYTLEEGGEWKYRTTKKKDTNQALDVIRGNSHTLVVLKAIHFETRDNVREFWSSKDFDESYDDCETNTHESDDSS